MIAFVCNVKIEITIWNHNGYFFSGFVFRNEIQSIHQLIISEFINVNLRTFNFQLNWFVCMNVCGVFELELDAQHGLLLLVEGGGGVVVEPLGAQHLGQLALVAARLLQLGPLILEPDLDLVFVQAQLLQNQNDKYHFFYKCHRYYSRLCSIIHHNFYNRPPSSISNIIPEILHPVTFSVLSQCQVCSFFSYYHIIFNIV